MFYYPNDWLSLSCYLCRAIFVMLSLSCCVLFIKRDFKFHASFESLEDDVNRQLNCKINSFDRI